jgi:hypothetical protein
MSDLKTFPRRVRWTADPSASLGMTKGRATLPWKVAAEPTPLGCVTENLGEPRGAPQIPPLRYAPVGMTKGTAALPRKLVAGQTKLAP